ncbi:MAG: PadR family transcriptional regulator [Candidatus Thorarchaeota archaeon]|jgi:DNA-binding PadR family transcriptional regulator
MEPDQMSIRPFLPTGGKITPMQMLIFIQLLEGPKYGYEILKNLRDDFDGIWKPKTGTVYPALKTLVKKGFISEKDVKDTTYYSMTKDGREFVSDTSDFVKDYVLFNYHFVRVAAERLPAKFTANILQNFLELGLDDLVPEATIIEAIREVDDIDLKRFLFEQRKRMLLDKVQAIRKEIQLIDSEKPKNRG